MRTGNFNTNTHTHTHTHINIQLIFKRNTTLETTAGEDPAQSAHTGLFRKKEKERV